MEILSLGSLKIDLDVLLSHVDFFQFLDNKAKRFIKRNIEVIKLDSHEILMTQGAAPDYTYIVYSGRLIAYVMDAKGKEKIIGIISHEEPIGEMSLLTKEPRTVNVRSIRESILFRISNSKLDELLRKNMDFTITFSRIMMQRMQDSIQFHTTIRPIRSNIYTIAVIAAGQNDITQEFINKVLPNLSVYKRTFVLNQNGFHTLERSYMLAKLENEYEMVILNGGHKLSDWTSFCIQNADCILLIGDVTNHPEQNRLEEYLFEKQSDLGDTLKYLVLVHPNVQQTSDAAKWLSHRDVAAIHHICLDNVDTLARMSRIITNKCFSMVLSGGGINGCAHIGALRALKEHKISIDAIGGVSAGSIIAALHAMGLDENALINKLKLLRKLNSLFSFQIPFASIMHPHKLKKMYLELFNDIQIEDVWINFFCLASNLHTMDDVVFERGSMTSAVMASNAFPGIVSPEIINGELYIDGGASNGLPIDVMVQKYPGTCIGVNVSRERGISIDSRYKTFPSTREVILNRFLPKNKQYKTPSLAEIINRAVVLGNKRKLASNKKYTPYIIEPELSKMQPGGTRNAEEIIEIGYRETLKKLEEWDL